MGSDSETKPKGSSIFSAARIKELFKKYGKVALGVHIVVYSTFLTGCYIALDQKQDVRGALAKIGLIPSEDENQQQEGDGNGSWMGRMLSGGGSTLALAVLCNKALFPIRTPITLALTPPVARFLRSRKIIKS